MVLGLATHGSIRAAWSATAPGEVVPVPHDDVSAVELVQQLTAGTVMIVPAQAGSAARRRLRRARKLAARTDVAVLFRHRPASRLVKAARMITDSQAFRPAEVAAAMDAVDASMRTTALLDSVGGLMAPVPSVSQHAFGLVPGTRFLVDLDGERVRRVGARLPAAANTRRTGSSLTTGGTATACASPAIPPSWPTSLVSLVHPAEVEELASVGGPEGCFWGVKRWAELTVLRRPEYDVLVAVRDALPFVSCPSCRQAAAGSACVFCRVALRHGKPFAAVSATPVSAAS